MTDPVASCAIADSDYNATISARYGGTLLGMAHQGRAILRPSADPKDALLAAAYPCVPYFGRLSQDEQLRDGATALGPTRPDIDPEIPIHGEGWISRWCLEHHDEKCARLSYIHSPQPGAFPFAYRTDQEIALSRDGLSLSLRLQNQDSADMPAGLGIHPFFPRTGLQKIQFEATRFWSPPLVSNQAGESDIPDDLDFSYGGAVPNRLVDHSFIGFKGVACLSYDDQMVILRTDAPILHLYAPSTENFICLEPVTHLPGRFGADRLAPGKSMALDMQLSVTAR